MEKLPRIALVIGDPAGIGPEIICRLLADPRVPERARITLIGNTSALEQGARVAGFPVPQKECDWLDILDWSGSGGSFVPGIAGSDNGKFMLDALALGVDMTSSGAMDALCFGPLNKLAMKRAGMQFPDEMRWFAHHLGYDGPCGEFNVLHSLWTARVTSHVALRSVSSLLTPEKISTTIRMLTQALIAAGRASPRIAVCGLNPHNGENGSYGDEESTVIQPGIELSKSRGFPADGPFPADTIFLRARKGQYDGIVTMYHDQGQIATKLMGFDAGVTVEGGLPIPITTPGHGTAYDIVGQGLASAESMFNALDLACRMGMRRSA